MGDSQEEEFVPEEEVDLSGLDEGEGESPAALKRLRERLKKAVEEKQEYLAGWQRSRADFANYKKEEAVHEREREQRIKAALVSDIMPVLDSLEMAFKQAQTKELNLLHKQLLDALRSMGVEFFGKTGERFDPRRHEALRQVPTDEPSLDHTVESVHRSGYSIGDTIVRAAQVSVYTHN
jgi:molecular chaperone GrpE